MPTRFLGQLHAHRTALRGCLALSPLSAAELALAPRAAIAGWLRLRPEALEEADDAALAAAVRHGGFTEHAPFLAHIHAAVDATAAEDATVVAAAAALHDGWLHVVDARCPPAWGRTAEPRDILGSVRVADGRVVRHSFQPMPAYRLLTADGGMQLPPAALDTLLAALRPSAAEPSA